VLEGEILPPARITPRAALLMGRAGKPIQAHVRIEPYKINPFDIKDAKAEDGKNIVFKLKKQKGPNGKIFDLMVSNLKSDPGRYVDKIMLTTTSKISPSLTVDVFGIIHKK